MQFAIKFLTLIGDINEIGKSLVELKLRFVALLYKYNCLKVNQRNNSFEHFYFCKSKATSTIISSWPPTILRFPNSTKISTVLIPNFREASSA